MTCVVCDGDKTRGPRTELCKACYEAIRHYAALRVPERDKANHGALVKRRRLLVAKLGLAEFMRATRGGPAGDKA